MALRTATAAALLGLTVAASSGFAVAAQPEGVYSADRLLDAEVYLSNSNEQVGEIDDVILDNDMRISAFIVETDGKFGLGGKSYVVAPDQLSVETLAGDKATEPNYRVTLDGDSSQLSGYPEYNDSWWNNAQTQANDAWEQTKESAGDAWTRLKRGTNNLIDRAQGQDPDGNTADTDTGTVIDNDPNNPGNN